MNYSPLPVFFITLFALSSAGLFAQAPQENLQNNAANYSSIAGYEGLPDSQVSSRGPWREVSFAAANNQPPVETGIDQQCQLIDSSSGAEIPNNEIVLKKGEQVLICCPDRAYGFDYCMNDDRFNDAPWLHQYHRREEEPMPDSLLTSVYLLGHGWDLWKKVSAHGPYFLLTAVKVGTTTVSIFYGREKAIPLGVLYKADTLLGQLKITVVEP